MRDRWAEGDALDWVRLLDKMGWCADVVAMMVDSGRWKGKSKVRFKRGVCADVLGCLSMSPS